MKVRGMYMQREYINKVRDSLRNGTIEPLAAAQRLTRLIIKKGAPKELVLRQFCRNLAAADADCIRKAATVVRLVSDRLG